SKRELLRQEQMAWDLIRDSRSLSANSQEVNRRLAALVERFRVENMTTYGETIKNLSEKLLSNPCINISQSDQEVLWSLLELVLEMIYEPVQNIRRNRGGMEHRRLHNPEAVEDAEQSAIDERSSPSNPAGTEDDWVALLSEDLLPPPSPFGSSSDNLSDWTDSDDPSEPSSSNPVPPLNTSLELLDMNNVYERAMESERAIVTSESNAFLPSPPPSSRSNFRITQPEVLILNNVHRDRLRRSKLPLLPPLKPPKLATVIELSVQDPERLPRLVHSYKWGPNVQIFTKPTNPHPMANFAVSYVQFLKRNVCGLIDYRLPSTTSEVYLLREILFMFVRPNSCQFFEVNKVTHKIKVREHISICSVTEVGFQQPGFQSFKLIHFCFQATIRHILNTEVLRALHDMWKVRRLIESNIMYLGYGSTGTLGCFLYGVKDLLQPISAALLEYEVLVNAVPTKGSLLDFVARFREPFRELHILRRLVDDVVLNIGPRFLRSAFLLSKLYMHTMPHVPHQKMAIALLMISLKRYMNIIDAWWSRASLEDFQSEFIVERWVDEVDIEQSGAVRRRTPGEDEDPRIKKVFQHVQRCPFYRLLLQHALDSGDSQELLANVGLLGEMLSATNDTKPLSLYEELADQLITQVKLYSTCMPTEEEVAVVDPKEALIKQQHNQLLADAGSLGNPDLRTLFVGCVEDRMEDKRVSKKMRQPLAAGSLLKRLEGATRMQLRVEVPEALGKILLRRQTLANVYAMRAYTKELRLGGHLRFLRHSMLLEGYFILLPFYQSLFRRIESGETWTRASQLTSELCEVQYTHYPKFATGMRFAVTSKVKSGSIKVYEALDGLEIAYDMSTSLHRVIRRRHMEVYNAVWRLMLKIKWALWKLENLPFIRRPKGDPYAPLDLLGLTVRRLEILRFWLMYLINSLHTHIMECLGQRVETEIGKCTNIRQMKNLIDEHTTALKNFCLLSDEFTAFRIALEQLFHLVFVLDMEWTSCTSYLSDEGDALALDASMSDDGSRDSTGKSLEYLALNQVGEIELTYIRCHQTLGEILNSLVYKDDHGFCEFLVPASAEF
ncbi:hypothetical protein KR074_009559, partial [Drosophila pseudoananassae]